MMETSLPAPGTVANQLTTEADFGDNLSGWEYRTQQGRAALSPTVIKGGRSH